MKFLLVCFMLVTFSYADEMQRIESIVTEITDLRSDYGKCMSELKRYKNAPKAKISDCSKFKKESKKYKNSSNKYKKLLQKAKKKNKELANKVAEYEKMNTLQEDSSLPTNVKILQRELNKYKLLVKIRDKKIKQLQGISTPSSSKASQESSAIPKLLMKEKYKNESTSELKTFKASSFRLSKDSEILDSPNGKVLKTWKKNRSFTSNQKSNDWIKITGYFVNKKWKKAQSDMWVKESDTLKR